MQNLLADAPALELARYVESFGESYLLDTLAFASREGSDPELRVPVSPSHLCKLTTGVVGAFQSSTGKRKDPIDNCEPDRAGRSAL